MFRPLLLIALVALLAGCGGSSGSGSMSAMPSSESSNRIDSGPVIRGTVARGAPLAEVRVTINDSRGAMSTAVTDANGEYECPVDGMQGPFLLQAEDMYCLSHEGGTMNANPMSDLMARLAAAAGGTRPMQMMRQAMPTAAGMRTLREAMMGAIAEAARAVGIDPGTFDPAGSPFHADHTGFDALLDHMQTTEDGFTLTHEGRTVTCTMRVEGPTMTMSVTTDGSTTSTTMTLPMHGQMMGER